MGDSTKEAPLHTDRTIEEEWSEIVICMGMLVDRIDRLASRAGCANRVELMKRLSATRKPALPR
jgi:hypothetical protein